MDVAPEAAPLLPAHPPAVIVKSSSGPRYVVGCRNKVEKSKLTPNTRVTLDVTTLTIMRILPREVRRSNRGRRAGCACVWWWCVEEGGEGDGGGRTALRVLWCPTSFLLLSMWSSYISIFGGAQHCLHRTCCSPDGSQLTNPGFCWALAVNALHGGRALECLEGGEGMWAKNCAAPGPVQVDPVVFNMLSEDPGHVDYSNIGGLSEQIRSAMGLLPGAETTAELG